MGITEFFGLLGGLALFLYGMQMLSNGLEDTAGDKMKRILEKLTSNRFLGILSGAGITAAVQSSSATTVMVVGFVNSGMMSLKQAVWIIMGANVGTTITGQLIALDIGVFAPLVAFVGVVMMVFLRRQRLNNIGKILAGFGILFIGMDIMGQSMTPLKESEGFVSLMTEFSNPLFAIGAGAIFTAIIQSSSASVGILQTLAASGLITFQNAAFVLFGQNIGTCITAVLASIGTNRSAKRTVVIHLVFNVVGTLIFTFACLALPVTEWVGAITPNAPAKQIANMHTVFNVTTTLLLLPFGAFLAKLSEKLLPDTWGKTSGLSAEFVRTRTKLGTTAIHTDLLKQETNRIVEFARKNTYKAFDAVFNNNMSIVREIAETEETVDLLNKEISRYISKILVRNNSGRNVAEIEQYFLIAGNAERISDHAVNIADYTKVIKNKNIKFSNGAIKELSEMQAITEKAFSKVLNRENNIDEWLSNISDMEQQIDDMTHTYRNKHLERMRHGKCSEEACILYSELLTDFERIGDHILNIAQAYWKIELNA